MTNVLVQVYAADEDFQPINQLVEAGLSDFQPFEVLDLVASLLDLLSEKYGEPEDLRVE